MNRNDQKSITNKEKMRHEQNGYPESTVEVRKERSS